MFQPPDINSAEALTSHPSLTVMAPLEKLRQAIRPYRRGFLVLLIPVSLLLTGLASAFPHLTESIYSRGIYPVLAGIFGRLFGFFPFSAAEILLYVLSAAGLVWLCVQLARLVRRKEKKRRALNMLATIGCIAGAGYFLFTVLCGFNYHRITFAEQSGLVIRPSSVRELGLLYAELVERANYLRTQVNENENGVMVFHPESAHTIARMAPQGIARLAERYPVFGGYTPPPKPALASRGLSIMNIAGVYIPFTFEANVNVDMPHFNIPFTMMHELAHFKGFMREDEANFIAYLACREMDDAAFQYSGVMLALIYAGNALFAASPELYREISAGLDAAILRDFSDNRAYWAQFEGPIAQATIAVNDAYLRHQRQEDGVRSYGRMVDLLLADFRARRGIES